MKRTDAASVPYFRAFYQNNRLRWAASLLLEAVGVCKALIVSWLLGALLDTLAAQDLARMGRLLACMVAAILFFTVLDLARYRVQAACIHCALAQYKELAFRNLSQKSISAFAQENTGRYLSVLTNDVNTIEEHYLKRTFQLVFYVLSFLGALAMMLWYSPLLTVVSAALCLLPLAGSLLLGGELTARERAVSDGNEHFVAQVKDLLAGFSVIKSFKAEGEAGALFARANRDVEEIKRRRLWWEGLLSTAGTDLCGLTMQSGILFLGVWLTAQGRITVGVVILFVNLSNCLLQPVSTVPSYWAARKAAKALVEKLAAVTAENTGRAGRPVEPVLRDAIELKQVTFGYEPGKPVLRDLSLRMEAGKKYALVGASGSGKSTLLNLLMGASDGYTGSITVDGQELRGIHPDSLYDLISLIGQNVFLFDDTLRRNITMFRDFPESAVARAVKHSGLASLLAERGEDYRCGENGCGLSGGERQRVSIARCLLRGTPVLLLDEATAALDNQTSFAVTDAILHLDGLTRVVVTHRLEAALLAQYDAIFVLRGGTLCECGTFDELMARREYFYSLYTVSNA